MRTLPLYLLAALPLTALALPAQKDFPPLLVESQETAAALEAAPERLEVELDDFAAVLAGQRREIGDDRRRRRGTSRCLGLAWRGRRHRVFARAAARQAADAVCHRRQGVDRL